MRAHTPSEYVITFAFPQQKYLLVSALMFHYMCIDCLVYSWQPQDMNLIC